MGEEAVAPANLPSANGEKDGDVSAQTRPVARSAASPNPRANQNQRAEEKFMADGAAAPATPSPASGKNESDAPVQTRPVASSVAAYVKPRPKAASKANESLLVDSVQKGARAHLQNFVKAFYRDSGEIRFEVASLPPEFYAKLHEHVGSLLLGCERRAKCNKRKVLQAHDFGA